jgi:hypothetical protein
MRARLEWLSAAIVGVGMLTVTSRRWSAPLLASALAMGLFVGVAFGPAVDRLSALGSGVIAVDSGAQPATETASTDAGTTGGGGGGSGGSGTTDTSTDTSYPVTPTADPYIPPPPTPTEPSRQGGGSGGGGKGPGPAPSTLVGTVVHVNPMAESYALAVRGELYAVHAKKLPEAGDRIEVAIAELANGTYSEDGERETDGSTEEGTLNGFVTFVDAKGQRPGYALSMRGVSVLIELPSQPSADEVPKLGTFVSVDVDIAQPSPSRATLRRRADRDPAPVVAAADESGCARETPARPVKESARLVQRHLEPTGDEYSYLDLAGTVQAICPGSKQLLISADDIRMGGSDLTLAAPKDIDLELLEIDQAVLATANVDEDGTMSVAGLASDEGIDGADDIDQLQGDFADDG